MKFVVFGTGGVGGYFGGKLAQAGDDVTFIARGEHLKAICERGLRVESINGDFTVHPAQATDDPASIGEVDYVLVAVKGWQLPEAILQMKPLVGARTSVVWLGNGIEGTDMVVEAFGRERVIGGLCRISSFVGGAGVIRHVGVSPSIAFGELDSAQSPRVEALRAAFARFADLRVEVPANIHVTMWEKFIFIAAVSGVGSVTRQPIGGYRSIAESRAMLSAALEETSALGRARGIPLDADVAMRILANIDAAAAGVIPSMQKDMTDGRPSELETQTGYVTRLGRALGIATPTHDFIYAALLPQEKKARGEA
ncbi:MAG: 2-dehydropantoate 2-reductase [Chloroflexi bacterium]|nr:2-dehydropantoate 2-reductase [Chloroflexota bacterium]